MADPSIPPSVLWFCSSWLTDEGGPKTFCPEPKTRVVPPDWRWRPCLAFVLNVGEGFVLSTGLVKISRQILFFLLF